MKVPNDLMDRLEQAIMRTEMPLVHKFRSKWHKGRWETTEGEA